jgi:hypothetical protein
LNDQPTSTARIPAVHFQFIALYKPQTGRKMTKAPSAATSQQDSVLNNETKESTEAATRDTATSDVNSVAASVSVLSRWSKQLSVVDSSHVASNPQDKIHVPSNSRDKMHQMLGGLTGPLG